MCGETLQSQANQDVRHPSVLSSMFACLCSLFCLFLSSILLYPCLFLMIDICVYYFFFPVGSCELSCYGHSCTSVFAGIYIFISLGKKPRSKISGSKGRQSLLKKHQSFLKMVVLSYSQPTMYECPRCATLLLIFGIDRLKKIIMILVGVWWHLNMVSIYTSPMTHYGKHLFTSPLAIPTSF